MITHVLFDFFGTLVDYSPSRTEQGYEQSFALLRSAGSTLDYEGFLSLWSEVSGAFDDVAGQTLREFSMVELGRAFLARTIGSADGSFVRDFVKTYVAEWNKGVRYFGPLPAMLERLAGRFTLAVITNTHDPELVPDHLERMGVAPHFRRVITSVEHGARKPAPAIFEHALRELGADPRRCLYVGDNYEADYVGAQAAGIRGLLIDPERRASVPPADRLASILDLEGRLEPDSPAR